MRVESVLNSELTEGRISPIVLLVLDFFDLLVGVGVSLSASKYSVVNSL